MIGGPTECVKDSSAAPIDPGEPFTTYSRLLLAVADTRDRLQAEQTRGNRNAIAAAELDWQQALEEFHQFRHHHVSWLMLVLRWCNDFHPAALAAHVSEALDVQLDRTQAAVMECEQRIDSMEAGT